MKRVSVCLLLLAGVFVSGQELRWKNSFDQPLDFNCPAGQSISRIESEHSNKHEDRVWDLHCKTTFEPSTDCLTSSYVNEFDAPFTYQCPGSRVITGMHSYHDNHYEDRRWTFTCCGASDFCITECHWTNYVNCFDEAFIFDVPPNSYLNAVSSYHEDHYEDRRWKYQFCVKKSC